MSERSLFLDESPGERRGVVTLDGAPERLFIERLGQVYPRLGARYRARVLRLERASGLAILDLGDDGQAVLRLKADRAPPHEGAALEIEISIEPQGDKAAVARLIGDGVGAAQRLTVGPSLEKRLEGFAPGGRISGGADARQAADDAQDAALQIVHGLPGGGSLAIETTRALTAIDVDLGAGEGADSKRAARQANLRAIAEAARLLRLKGLGGLIIIDLIGRGHDGQALAHAAQTAFAADQPGVVTGPITRFGTLELSTPRRYRPIADILCGPRGGLTELSAALQLLRAAEREAQADRGARLNVRAPPGVIAQARSAGVVLQNRIGGRIEFEADESLAPAAFEIRML